MSEQKNLPGVETSKIPAVAKAAAVVLRHKRSMSDEKEQLEKATETLVDAMHKHDIREYKHDGTTFALEETEKLKITTPKAG